MEAQPCKICPQDALLKILCIVLVAGCWLRPLPAALAADRAESQAVPVYGYEIVASYDHDPQAFTQGFCFDQGRLYEGTGLYGHSTLRRMTIDGRDLEVRALPAHLFGEGVTVFGERIIQLTWQSRTGMVWDRESLRFIRSFPYATEGWGITHDGHSLIMSDGSATLAFLDPESFTRQKTIMVTEGGQPVTRLNELEYIKGEIWANIWKEGRIARINPANGQVTGWVDLRGLALQYAPGDEDSVLNGIAYDRDNDRIYVTGKRWSRILAIRVMKK
ncbi:MAG: glutaminyl-peptide cyclotransferase [Desulfobulbaceae bacterium]|nr:glutaminyl-peptide cyclotransferase [Desulfobulbaceae bacterium]